MKMFHGTIVQKKDNMYSHTTHCLVSDTAENAFALAMKYCLDCRPFNSGWSIVYTQNDEVPMDVLKAMKPYIP